MDLARFKGIFDQYYEPIKNYLYYKLGDLELSEDLTQEVFVKTWEKRDELILDTIKSYLYKVAANLAINHYKSARNKYEFELSEGVERSTSEDPAYDLQSKEFAEQLKNAIANLPENQRVVFLMNRIDDLTYKEIATRLELSVKSVEKRMHKALGILRETIHHKI